MSNAGKAKFMAAPMSNLRLLCLLILCVLTLSGCPKSGSNSKGSTSLPQADNLASQIPGPETQISDPQSQDSSSGPVAPISDPQAQDPLPDPVASIPDPQSQDPIADPVASIPDPQSQDQILDPYIRPRLFLTEEKISQLKSVLTKEPYYSKFWTAVKSKADSYILTSPPISIAGCPGGNGPNRSIGDYIPYMAIAYLLTNNSKYLDGARTWMDAAASYADWCNDDNLAAAHILMGMSLGYDWLYDYFTPSERDKYRDKITYQTNIQYNLLITNGTWWSDEYLNNHNYIHGTAIAMAGIALHGEKNEADLWMTAAKENFVHVLGLLSPDGASHEGISYWVYGTYHLLQYFGAMERFSSEGESSFKANEFFQNTALFRLYTSAPGYLQNVGYADSAEQDNSGPEVILRRLASVFHDGKAQWLAMTIEQVRQQNNNETWLDLIWYDESVAPESPENLPTYHYFQNLGILASRSDWTNDAMWTVFKAGPPGGIHAEEQGVYPGNHIHPDEGNFVMWGNGEWLTIDDGYVSPKRTNHHNLLIFNDAGQLGEGYDAFDGDSVQRNNGTVELIHVDLSEQYQYVVSEMSKIYPAEANLLSWKRSFVTIPATRIVVIRDDVTLKSAGKIDSFVHAEISAQSLGGNGATLNPGGANTYIYKLMYPLGQSIGVQKYTIPEEECGSIPMNPEGQLLSFTLDGVETATLIHFMGSSNISDADTDVLDNGDIVKIRSQSNEVTINFSTRNVSFN